MNMDHLKYLIEIGQSRSMSEAAEKLFITPQALSMAIKKLEKELEMTLLYRFSNGVMLSEDGEWLAKLSQYFFGEIGKRVVEFERFRRAEALEPQGKVDIAVNMMDVPLNTIASMVCDIYERYPNFEVNVSEMSKEQIVRDVLDEKMDMGFIYRTKVKGKYIDDLDPMISFHPLQRGYLVVQAAPQLPIAKYDIMPFMNFADYKFCGYRTENMLANNGEILKKLFKHDFDYHPVNSFTQYAINIATGKYLGISLQMLGEETCAGYLEGMKTIYIKEDICAYFGIIRKGNRNMSDNMAFIYQEAMKTHHLTAEKR